MKQDNKIVFDKNLAMKLLPAILLIAAVYMAFSIRMESAYSPYYPDIDTYYIFRMSEHVLTNEFHIPGIDTLRYYPTYIDMSSEYLGVYYFPSLAYALLTGIGLITEEYAHFAWWFPALIGALTLIPIYFIGKELHNRITGLFSAFFFAVTPAILARNSAWYMEKEVQATFFMLISLYFFIRALRTNSMLSGTVSGLSLFVLATMWGGVQQLFLGYSIFVLMVLLVDKVPKGLYKTYVPVVLIGVVLSAYFTNVNRMYTIYSMLNLAAFGVLSIRYFAEKYSFVAKEKLRLVVPSIYGAGVVFLVIGSFVSSKIAGLLMSAQGYLFYQHGVISSTVAENIPPTWDAFSNQLGAAYAQGAVPSVALLIRNHLFDVWALGFLGLFIFLYKIYEKRDTEFWLASTASGLVMYSFWAFLKATEAAAKATYQPLFVASFVAAILLVSRKNYLASLLYSLLFVAMLGAMSYIRMIFMVGPFIALAAAYGLSNIISYASKAKIFRAQKDSSINIYSAAGALVIGLLLFVNFSAGNVMAKNMGSHFNANWAEAMNFMKTESAPDAVILSWWDYGYWFQLMGERATNLDGGNSIASRNIPTAQYFTGMMNETEQKFFLEKMGTTHILIDASMIGKYSAMSKIANYGNKIDAYLQFGQASSEMQGNITIVAFSANPYFLLVPINEYGNLAGQIVMSVPGGEVYVSSVCTENGIFPMNPPKNKETIDGCIFLGQGYALFASGEVANSAFTNLFFMHGKDIPYADKVFDNGEVMIYEINAEIKSKPREELLPWWKNHHDGDGLRVYDGKERIYQKVD